MSEANQLMALWSNLQNGQGQDDDDLVTTAHSVTPEKLTTPQSYL